MKNITKPCALTIGKFEGIHVGHQALIREVIQQAQSLNLASAIMIFEPHPYIHFQGPDYKPLLTFAERELIIQTTSFPDYVLYCSFSQAFANQSPKEFCEFIFSANNAKLVTVGENFRFGKNRAGDIVFLRSEAKRYGAEVRLVPPKMLEGQIISTTNIRHLIENNRIKEAQTHLGFPFFISGVVTKGKQIGKTLGFPTLNIYPPQEKFLPPDGVYATQTKFDGTTHPSITNIGLRPTFDDVNKVRSVETHLLHYSGDLYNKHICVEFLEFIRPECRFTSLDELRNQISQDILYHPANNLFSSTGEQVN